ncbi:hypothetical protein Vi05172_g7262 [Venturia inaequalis]|nr:hypothetical protein Vi05172_g7262 [Venturia inaequalis]
MEADSYDNVGSNQNFPTARKGKPRNAQVLFTPFTFPDDLKAIEPKVALDFDESDDEEDSDTASYHSAAEGDQGRYDTSYEDVARGNGAQELDLTEQGAAARSIDNPNYIAQLMRDMEATNIDDETSSLKARLGALLDVRMPFLREVSEAEREEASHNLVIVLNESNKVFEAQAAQAAADQIKADEEAAAEAEGENTESLAAQQEAANKATNKAAKRKRARESKTLRAGYINHTKKMICQTCQKPNHIAKDCPDKHSKTPKGSHMKKSDPTNAPPTAGLPFSRQERVQMQAVFMVDEDHQTTVELEFVANYFRPGQQDVSDKDKKWTHPKAVLRLTPKNIAVPIEHRASWELEELLALGMSQSEAEAIKNDSFVQCAIITWGTCNEPDALERLGVSIFSNMEYGPFTEQMHSIRDLFHTPVKMHVFYTGEAGPCAFEIAKINRSIQKQRETDPRGKWFKNGQCNP